MADRCSHLRLAKGLCSQCADDAYGRACVLIGAALTLLLWGVLRG